MSTLIVPTDFTKQAYCALDHAIGIAKLTRDVIVLVHIITDETKKALEKEGLTEGKVNDKLRDLGLKASEKHGVNINFILKEGSIFKTFGELAEEQSSRFIVMGTHGVVGIEQHLFGAHALRVVDSSPVPVIVVQSKNMEGNGYKKIVFPIFTGKEKPEKIEYTVMLAEKFGSKVYLYVIQRDADDTIMKQVKENIEQAKKALEEKNIIYEVVREEPTVVWPGYSKQTIKYAKEIDADLIVIQTNEADDQSDYIVDSDNEKVINNEPQIPVLCINEKVSSEW